MERIEGAAPEAQEVPDPALDLYQLDESDRSSGKAKRKPRRAFKPLKNALQRNKSGNAPVRRQSESSETRGNVVSVWDLRRSEGNETINLSDLLDNDVIEGHENPTLFIPVPQVLKNGTIVQNDDGEYVFVPDEGAVGRDTFAYFILGDDEKIIGGGIATVEADNPIEISTASGEVANFTAYASDGGTLDLSLEPGEDPVDALVAEATQGPFIPPGDNYSVDNYTQSVKDLTVIDNGDGTSTVRFSVSYWAIISDELHGPLGTEQGQKDFEFVLANNGTSTSAAPPQPENGIDLLPVLDVLPGQSDETTILEINGVEITEQSQDVQLESGATVHFNAATGTLRYTPAAGQTTNDRFDVRIENGGFPRTRTIEVTNSGPGDLPVARRDSITLFQPAEEATHAFSVNGADYTFETGTFTDAERIALNGVNWSEAFDTTIFFDPNGTNGALDNLGLFHWLGGDAALTNKVLDTTFTSGGTSFTLRDVVYGTGTSPAPFDGPQAAGQFFQAALNAGTEAPQLQATINPLANDSSTGDLQLTDVSVVDPDSGIAVSIVGNQISLSAEPGVSGDFTLSYTVTDETGATSQSFVNVTISDQTEAEAIETNFATSRLQDASGMDLTGLDFERTAEGDYRVSLDNMESFTIDGDSFLFGPDLIQQMLIQFAIAGGAQALQQLHGEATHFDLSDPEQKQLYEMFITVAAELGLTEGPYGDHFDGLLDTDRVFSEMTSLLFGTDAGDKWIRDNIDDSINALDVEPGFEALDGLGATELFDQLLDFFTAEPPTELVGANGEALTAEQKDVVMANYLNQIGFLANYKEATPDEAAVDTGVEALADYAADIYAPDAAEALRDELLDPDTLQLDLSTLFNGLSDEEALLAIQSGDYEAFGYTEDEFLTLMGDTLFELATAGLEIRNAATNPDQIQGLLGLMAQVFPPNATQAEVKAFVDDVVLYTAGTRRAGSTANIMDDFYTALDTVGKRPQHSKFASAGANFKSYNAALTGNRPIAGTLPGPDAGGFLLILTLGVAGLALNDSFSGSAAEKLTSAGWLALLISGTATGVDKFIGPVGTSALKIGPLQSLIDDLSAIQPAPAGQPLGAFVAADDVTAALSDEAFDDVGKLLKNPAVQKLATVRGLLQAIGSVGLAGGTGALGVSLALQASQQDNTALKATQAATSALWLGTSVGASVSGAASIAKSLGVTVGSTGSKVAAIAGKTAGILARATAFAYAIVGGIQGVQAQNLVQDTWDILMRPGGPDNENGYFVKPEHHDLEPYGDAAAGLWGALSSLFGFPPPTGFRPEYDAGTSGGIFGTQGGPSDIRLKIDIERIGYIEHLDMPLYAWRYRSGDHTRYVGVMAQELLEKSSLRHAVITYEHGELAGYYGVDYHALGLRFLTEAAYDAGEDLILDRHKAARAA